MTVLVTGGSGLVGSHVIEALRTRGEPVRALVRNASRSIVESFGAEPAVGDVTDAESWRRASAGVRAIVHSAALVAHRAPFAEFERVNVGGTRLAIEAARREGARLVHVSTVAVYGRPSAYRPGMGPVAEDFPFQPLSPSDFYARTKRAAEQLVRDSVMRDRVDAIAIRPNVIYGERDRLFTARLIATLRHKVVPRIGPGTNHLSCVYAGNVASAIMAALDSPPATRFRAYNVTRDAPPLLTQREFLVAFARTRGLHVRFVPVPVFVAHAGVALWSGLAHVLRPGKYLGLAASAVWFIVAENPFDAGRIERELEWKPPFDTRAAIARSA